MSIAQLAEAVKDAQIIELGQYLEEKMPTHPSHSKFYKMVWHSFANGDSFLDHQLVLNEHNGTHVDSFGHYMNKPGYELIDKLPLRSLCGICVTIDASFLKERETLNEEHITAWEQGHGQIQPGEIVLIDFNWMRYWDLRPNERRFVSGFPGLGASGAEYLVARGVKMVGVDTLGVDADQADGDPAHNTLLSHRIPIVENLRNLDKLHDRKAYFVMLPLLIRNGSASPVRPVALIDAE
ncbi:MAG: cyclase family protein [Spirochaetales bacterium]|jgi:kynurenine formamidase|nr:cyclase family protein [Spirochaetales bacterium]